MKHCIVEDSSFLVATMDSSDEFHTDAIFVFRAILEQKNKIKIVFPPLVIYETIVTLRKKGVTHETVESKILALMHIDNVMILSLSELSAFKHSKKLLTSGVDLRTHDYFIASMAIDYEAQILTFDTKMFQKIKPFYEDIYFCSDKVNGINNCTADFIKNLNYFL